MKTPQCKLSITLPAGPEAVFDALTNSKKILAWSGGQRGIVEPKVGGKFEFFDGWVKGKVLAYERGKRLSYTWLTADWPEGTQASVVSYVLTKAGARTKISLTHAWFPNAKEMKSHKSGWTEYVFNPLKHYFSKL